MTRTIVEEYAERSFVTSPALRLVRLKFDTGRFSPNSSRLQIVARKKDDGNKKLNNDIVIVKD